MKSMTGFGEGGAHAPAGQAKVAIATVNHKTTSIQLRGDVRDLALEERLREQIRNALGRGSATVQIAWEPSAAAGVDRERIASAWRELAAIAAGIGAPVPALADAVALVGRGRDDATIAAGPISEALAEALRKLELSRQREGTALQAALLALAARMRQLHADMTPLAAARMPTQRERLIAVVSEAVGRAVPADVLAREVAIEAQRIDIAEELTRLAAHLDALDRLLARTDPIGRELEFLCQELGREANTAGAKANDAQLSEVCIALKVAVDQMKEQAANCV